MPVIFCHFLLYMNWFMGDFRIRCAGEKITKNKDLNLLTAVSLVIQYARSTAKKIGHP